MTTTIIIILALAIVTWAVFRKKSMENEVSSVFSPKENADNLSEPIISYTLYVLDSRLNRRLEMQAPKEFSNQFGILNGQTIELHWNVLNADWISIDGIGYVEAIGMKTFYPTENTQYKISAKNRNHSAEAVFFVRVFPVPVMEKLMVKMPEITRINIELFKTQIPSVQRLESVGFPTLQIPGSIKIQRDHTAVKPVRIELNNEMINQIQFSKDANQYKTLKSKLFDKMENSFKDNYKIRDIIQTIRKHYDH